MERFDPKDLRALLTHFVAVYPRLMEIPEVRRLDDNLDRLHARLTYLAELGLIEYEVNELSGREPLGDAKATHKAIDFLRPDGGLGAEVNGITIRLHAETLKTLIAAQIERAEPDQTQRQKLLRALRELPAESTRHLALKLVDLGLESGPAALRLLQTLLG
jgi:hypothetical protein